jgi:hypothetical protein
MNGPDARVEDSRGPTVAAPVHGVDQARPRRIAARVEVGQKLSDISLPRGHALLYPSNAAIRPGPRTFAFPSTGAIDRSATGTGDSI